MSRMRGASRQPDSLTRLRMSSGAPQERHASAALSFMLWHHWHWMRSIGSAAMGAFVICELSLISYRKRWRGRPAQVGRPMLRGTGQEAYSTGGAVIRYRV